MSDRTLDTEVTDETTAGREWDSEATEFDPREGLDGENLDLDIECFNATMERRPSR